MSRAKFKRVRVAPEVVRAYKNRPISLTTLALALKAGFPGPSAVSQVFTGRSSFAATEQNLERVAVVARALGVKRGAVITVDEVAK
jgi:hypothetical protein